MKRDITPVHQWTNGGAEVLILKCVNADLTSYNGFRWPESGEVCTPNWSPEATCESGGLFGWPWGIGIGGGKAPDYTGRWVVFAAAPANVVSLGDKCKAGPCARVIYVGTWYGAWTVVRAGQIAWTLHASSGAASATGDRGAASATGYSGAASATGHSGAASATGSSGAASATGHSGAASATGSSGAASATGDRGAASATGSSGAASATGDSGAASATGHRGAASATGDSGAASATGSSGAASATGHSGAASATGHRGAASATGDESTIDVGDGGIASCTADVCYWIVRDGAVMVQRWATYKQDGSVNKWHTAVFDATDFEAGMRVRIKNGRAKVIAQ